MTNRHPDDPIVDDNTLFSVHVTETIIRTVYVHTHGGHNGAEKIGLAYIASHPDADNVVASVSTEHPVSVESFSQCENGATLSDGALTYRGLQVVVDA